MEEYKVPKSSWFFIGICKINTHVPTLESSKALHGYNSKEAAKEEIAYNHIRGAGEQEGAQN